MPFGQLAQTVTVVNKSGKVVNTSKQLVNVWKEAKAAYRERKAEIHATRDAELERKRVERHALKQLEDDHGSRASSRASRSKHPQRSKSHRRAERPPVERGYTDSFYANDNLNIQENRREAGAPPHRSAPKVQVEDVFEDDAPRLRNNELVRRHTDGDQLTAVTSPRRHSEPRLSHSARSSIDMDLAYGELPPPLPARRHSEEDELRVKMSALTMMLTEANCLQYSVTAMIEHLQKHPDALAAVALTLAEISNLATKMAPGALTALKGSFPAAVALLASPQFLIAAGVGVGITVVMLGGYKVIKRLKEKKETARELEDPLELQQLEDVDLGRIENWRRGIADAEAESVSTTVDGEYMTPGASRRLVEEGVLRQDDLKSTKSKKGKSGKDDKHRHRRSSRDDANLKAGSSSSHRKDKDKDGKKKKAVSGLKMLFQGHSNAR